MQDQLQSLQFELDSDPSRSRLLIHLEILEECDLELLEPIQHLVRSSGFFRAGVRFRIEHSLAMVKASELLEESTEQIFDLSFLPLRLRLRKVASIRARNEEKNRARTA